MVDDWSLKGAKCRNTTVLMSEDGVSYEREEDAHVYPDIVIDTLRRKLIEDIMSWAVESDKFLVGEVVEPIRIINKRFGVD